MMRLIGGDNNLTIKRMLLQRSKNAVADLTAIDVQAVTCQGLQRHPFPGKDIVKSLAGGTAVRKIDFQKLLKSSQDNQCPFNK
jgi:hypothetical protein